MKSIIYILKKLQSHSVLDTKVHSLVYLASKKSDRITYDFEIKQNDQMELLYINSDEIKNIIEESSKVDLKQKQTLGGESRTYYYLTNEGRNTSVDVSSELKEDLDRILSNYGQLPISNLLAELYPEQ